MNYPQDRSGPPVDWQGKLEAVMGMNVFPAHQTGRDSGEIGLRSIQIEGDSEYWVDDSGIIKGYGWRIRNRKEPAVSEPEYGIPAKEVAMTEVETEVWDRVVGLVQKMADGSDWDSKSVAENYHEAREIAKLLPVEADPDLAIAGEMIETSFVPDNEESRDLVLAAIKRGRELERGT